MEQTDAVQLRIEGGVATITLCRPEKANALQPGDMHLVAGMIGNLSAAGEAGVIVLTAAGDRHFCAGLDLSRSDLIAADVMNGGPTGLGAVLRAARHCALPVIGRINGVCVGGGMGLMAACDVIIATAHARFELPEIRAGQVPYVVTVPLARRLPPAVLSDLAFGTPLSANRALELGLVSAVVPAGELDDAVAQRAASCLALGPAARANLVRQLRTMLWTDEDFEAQLQAAEDRLRATYFQRETANNIPVQ